MDKVKKKEILILALCIISGFALRFYTFDKKSLWLDEIYTFNDSRYGINDQLKYYQENPTYLHPPLFFILTHLFHPFTKPERDLRIIPLIFGILSIPMIYLLSRQFSPSIALPCAFSLTFMTYHISLSQEGRSYALLMFIGMTGLYFLMKHLHTSRKRYLPLAAFFFATMLYTSYSSLPFVTLSQLLWFYRVNENDKNSRFCHFLIFNGFILLFCLPWLLFVALNYRDQAILSSFNQQNPVSFQRIVYGIIHDWVPHLPLTVVSVIILVLFPVFSRFRKISLLLLAVLILPVVGLYLFFKFFGISHFLTSRYFISFLPLFLIALYSSLDALEAKFRNLKRSMHLKQLFIILFVLSSLVILPFYYRSEKQDFRGMVAYLKGQLKDGDKIIVLGTELYFIGILHYFGIYPDGKSYSFPSRKVSQDEIEYWVPLVMGNKKFTISHSKDYWIQYGIEGTRLWIVANKITAKEFKKIRILALKGYFDGSVLNFDRFPTDASMYLFLWDPKSPGERGIEMPFD
jgi:mannosyltransferase